MSVYAPQFEHLLSSTIEGLKRDLGSIASKHAAAGQFHSGATLIKYQQAAYTALEKYPQRLLSLLTAMPNEHSPVQEKDFKLAKGTIKSLRAAIEQNYKDYHSKIRGPEPGLYISASKLDVLEAAAIAKVSAAEEYCRSQRSFLKWALGDLKKQIWSGFLVGVGALIGGVLTWVGGPASTWLGTFF